MCRLDSSTTRFAQRPACSSWPAQLDLAVPICKLQISAMGRRPCVDPVPASFGSSPHHALMPSLKLIGIQGRCTFCAQTLVPLSVLQESNKQPKVVVNLQREVMRVSCTDMKSFSLVLGSAPGHHGKSKKKYKPGDSLYFGCEDSKELTDWVNELTALVRTATPRAGHTY